MKHHSHLEAEPATGRPAGDEGIRRITKTKTHGSSRAWHRGRWFIIGLVVLLVIVRLMLPYIVERYVNQQLNRAKDFGGRVGSIHLQLWRGQYRINDLKIFKRNGQIHTPFFSAVYVYLSIEWKELFHGSVVGKIILDQPHLNFVSGPTPAQTQTGKDEGWNDILKSLFPFNLNRLEIIDGQIHFQNQYSTPPVDIYLNSLAVTATNLNNSRDIHNQLPAGVTAKATTIGGGSLDLSVNLNPMTDPPTYQLTTQLTNVNLVAMNDFLKAYGKFDVERGAFALFASVAAQNGDYEGYLKVFFNHLQVFAWEKERKKNALEIFWQAVVGTVTDVLKNHAKDSLATRVPISGTYKNSKVGTWTAIGTLLRNAFIRALVPKMDEHITLENVQQKVEDKKKLQHTPPPEKGAEQMTQPPAKAAQKMEQAPPPSAAATNNPIRKP